MKYLKLFEDIENDLWDEISFHDFEDHEVIKLPERIQKEIISLFKLPLNSGWSLIGESGFILHPSNTTLSIHLDSPFLYDWSLTFELCDDYWYLVNVDEGNTESHYKCDDIIGIKSLLQHLKILK
jgi:hypothetical protein